MTRHALRPAPRFELLAQLLMSTNAEAELKRFNPFLKRPCAAVREQNRTEQNRTPALRPRPAAPAAYCEQLPRQRTGYYQ